MLATSARRAAHRLLPPSETARNVYFSRPASLYHARHASTTSNFHPIIRDFAGELSTRLPSFRVEPRKISVLQEPKEFFETLLDMIGRANSRIFISSLYIGEKETKLISALADALRSKPHLQVYLQLDLNRSTRPGISSTTKILLPLIRDFPDRIHVSLFRSPHLNGIMAKLVPPRFNEGWGTWHAKIYGSDNEIMISGANLNKSYFTDRQDRYIHFNEQPALAQYCFDFLQVASTFSFRLSHSSSSPTDANPHSYIKEDYAVSWPEPDLHPHRIHDRVHQALSQLQDSYIAKSKDELPSDDVVIYPLIQAGQFGIREEETVFDLLFNHLRTMAPSRPLLDLTSGYFSLYQQYQELILSSSNVDCRVVAASPEANGFYGSAGLSGRIPEAYTLYEQRFMKAVTRASRLWVKDPSDEKGRGILLSEWAKPGWTYHAKGIWLSPDSNSHPILTLFGSTNLNDRSAHLDTELSFMMIVPSMPTATPESPSHLHGESSSSSPSDSAGSLELRAALAQEISHIRENTVEWKGVQRKVRLLTKLLVRLLKGML